MTADPLDLLDANEFFMLGLQSSGNGDSGSAIGYFKLALSRDERHARAHWALAAEYAALKMPDRGTQHFARAVELDPHQPMARFQWGLLLLTSGEIDKAQSVWEPLDALDAHDPVRLFKQGLLLMVKDEFEQSLHTLRGALARPGLDPALARDVEMTISRVEQAQTSGADNLAGTSAPVSESLETHLAFSAYRSVSDGKN